MFKRLIFPLVAFLLAHLCACTGIPANVERVYQNRAAFLEVYPDKNFIISRDYKHFSLQLYNEEGRRNDYWFEISDSTYILYRDTLQYEITEDEVPARFNNSDEMIMDMAQTLHKMVRSYEVEAFACNFKNSGIDMLIYMDDGWRMMYIRDISKVEQSSYKDCLIPIDSVWYYSNFKRGCTWEDG